MRRKLLDQEILLTNNNKLNFISRTEFCQYRIDSNQRLNHVKVE